MPSGSSINNVRVLRVDGEGTDLRARRQPRVDLGPADTPIRALEYTRPGIRTSRVDGLRVLWVDGEAFDVAAFGTDSAPLRMGRIRPLDTKQDQYHRKKDDKSGLGISNRWNPY